MKVNDIKRMAHEILENNEIESDHVEYKKSIQFQGKILKTACAYANNFMNRDIGLIYIGVEEVDDKQTGEKAFPKRPITGVPVKQIESTENKIKALLAHIHPRIRYHLIQDEIDKKSYVIIAVEPGMDGPYETSDKAEKDKDINLKAGRYIRVKRDTRFPNKREEFELLRKFAGFNFTSELNETATLEDLNYEYMKEYLVKTKAAKDIQKLSKLQMAKKMGLIDDSKYSGYRAKNFAVLMFADKPSDFIPGAEVQVIREAVGTDKMSSKTFDGPIWIQAQQVVRYFKDNIIDSYTIRGRAKGTINKLYNWPIEMVEELATNCILHKEYDKTQYIGIYVYHDHLSFVNHNRPLPPVTIEDMNTQVDFDDRNYLNPEIAKMFFALKLIQSYVSGLRRAKDAMKANESPKLEFRPADNNDDDYTQAIAYINQEYATVLKEDRINKKGKYKKGDKSIALSSVADGTSLAQVMAQVFPEDVSKKLTPIVIYLEEHAGITTRDVMDITGKSKRTSLRYLEMLIEKGIVKRSGETNSTRYHLAE